MNKKLTFLLAYTLLFYFSSSVYANDLQDAAEAILSKSYDKALKLLIPLARQGNSTAQYNLGVLYSNGDGVSQDFKEAIKWYRLAAEQEYPKAQFSLGSKYMQGQGVTEDLDEVIKWFRLAEKNGVTDASVFIGLIC
jgi:TPR repeat protein